MRCTVFSSGSGTVLPSVVAWAITRIVSPTDNFKIAEMLTRLTISNSSPEKSLSATTAFLLIEINILTV